MCKCRERHGCRERPPQAPGLMALSLGLSHNFADDHEMLKHGMVMYDALYAWCRSCQKKPTAGRRKSECSRQI